VDGLSLSEKNRILNMKNRKMIVGGALLLCAICGVAARADVVDTLSYRAEMQGTYGSEYTPFWIVGNRYGMIPLEASNAYLSAGAFYAGGKGDFRWGAGLDVAAVEPRYRAVMIRQAFGEISFRGWKFLIGSKEEHRSLWDRELSSGDMVLSDNARPVPEIRISIPEYVSVLPRVGWFRLRGAFSVGRSFDREYLKEYTGGRFTYVDDVLWHYKSLHFKFADGVDSFPFSFELGLQHGAQWGGTSSNPKIGKQPQSVKDFIRVVLGMSGDETATASDQINVLGNQYGAYDLRLNYSAGGWGVHAYHQRYFEDKSGTEFLNGMDGLWGAQVDFPSGLGWVRKLLVEVLETRDQTGPFHFIEFDHVAHPGIGGGGDNYYNNGEYQTGLSYFNRAVGSPLLVSPEYNSGGQLGFLDTRIHCLHLGISGNLSKDFSWRVLFTSMETWGMHHRPYLNTKKGNSGLCELTWQPSVFDGWSFTGMLGADSGNFLRKKGIGGGIVISKRGILARGRIR
jgi:hypothetical protein